MSAAPTATLISKFRTAAIAAVTSAVVVTGAFTIAHTDTSTHAAPAATVVATPPTGPDGLQAQSTGALRDYVDVAHRAAFDQYMADPTNRTTFLQAFQGGVNRMSAHSGVQNVLAYGWSGDHVWVTASYADMARGAIWIAVNYCSRYVPSFICNAAGNWLSSLAQGYAPWSNHGVWGALYWNHYTGGRW